MFNAVHVLLFVKLIDIKMVVTNNQYSACECNTVGDRCNYQCHCFSSICSAGHCQPEDKCEQPFFGYYCQYENIIFKSNEVYAFATDNDVSTCHKTGAPIHLTYNQNMVFSFISLTVENVAVITESYKRKNITLNYKFNHDIFACRHQEIWEVSRTILEIRCLNETILFSELTIFGASVQYICEIHLSGGRSTGLNLQVRGAGTYKENTVNGIINNEECFYSASSWEVTLSKSFQVYHIRVHNIPENQPTHMLGFRIRVKDKSEVSLLELELPLTYQRVHEIAVSSQTVASKVIIDNPHGSEFIALCEVEILGAGTAIPTTAGTAIPTTAGTVIHTTAGTVIHKTAGTAIPTAAGTVIPTPAGAVIPTTAGTVIPTTAGTVIPTTAGTVILTSAGTVMHTSAGTVVPTTAGTVILTPAVTVIPTAAGTVILTPAGAVMRTPAGIVVPTTAGTVIPTTAGTVIPTASGTVIPTTAGTVTHTAAGTVIPTTAGTVTHTTAGTVIPTTASTVIPTTASTVIPTTV
ncbi:hypothetical protein Btru_013991 [Bulinus truncatus]|nr:hypothetical protein Btru_013991 [Bulinus truncatus]